MEKDKRYPDEKPGYISIEELQKMGEFGSEVEVKASAHALLAKVFQRVTEGKTIEVIDDEKGTRQELILPVFEVLQDIED